MSNLDQLYDENKKIISLSVLVVAIIWCLFQLYTAAFGVLPALLQRSVHLMFALILIFLVYPFSPKKEKELFSTEKLLFIILSIAAVGYIASNHISIWSQTSSLTTVQEITSFMIIILILEASRRAIGLALPLIALLSIVYAYFGNLLPPLFQHRGFGLDEIFRHSVMGLEGIFGIALGVAATFVFLFIFYAAILQVSGGGQFFIDLASSLVGRIRGGPAKIAVIASAFFGSISGSAVANTAGTGAFTIPLMKSTGYKKRFAGAVEAVSSTGGQFMPPIMGTAAFLIAEVLAIPFWQVALGALIPGILYYIAVFCMVDLEAAKQNIKGLDEKEIPSFRKTLKKGWHLLLSPLILIYLLLVLQWSPMSAAFWAIIATFVSTLINKHNRVSLSQVLLSMRKGSIGALETTIACACIGIVIGIINQTGLGFSLSSILISLAGESLILLLILTMVASIILGMGLPTVAAYLVLSVMVAPALVNMGVFPLAAHLFIFYFGIISAITPPVALASIVAAGIAKEKPLPTSITALRLGVPGFLIPYMFVFGPELILEGTTAEIIISTITAIAGVFALAIGAQTYFMRKLKVWESILFIGISLMLLYPELLTDIVGITIFLILLIFIYKTKDTMNVQNNKTKIKESVL